VEREVSRGRSSYDCAAGAGSGEGPNVEESHRTRISSGVIGRCPETELPSERRGEAPRVRRSGANQSASGDGAQGAAGLDPPQLCEPPYTDPYVRWWGRGVAGISGYPLSRLVRQTAVSERDEYDRISYSARPQRRAVCGRADRVG
jgi:hypothetical protein